MIRTGKIEFEGGSLPGLAVNENLATALFDDAVDGGQSQARPLAQFLGGEKRLEDARYRGFVHAGAGVAYGQEEYRPAASDCFRSA